MPIYFIFIIIAIVIAIFSEKIDEKVNANGKLRRAVTIFCILLVILISILIKKALQEVGAYEENCNKGVGYFFYYISNRLGDYGVKTVR